MGGISVVDGNLLSLVEQGGVVMYPLLLCSIVSVAIIIERSWALTRGARLSRRLHELAVQSIREAGVVDAAALCRHDRSLLAPAYHAVLAGPLDDGETAARTATRKLAEIVRGCKRAVWLLGTIGSLAPFIGLFGTVVGIMRAFEKMAATGSGGFAVVAAGISEALIATAGGLLVGVIAIFAYNAMMVRINNLSAEFRQLTDELLVLVSPPTARNGVATRVIQSS
jgi:biopolymer transport protein ExbB